MLSDHRFFLWVYLPLYALLTLMVVRQWYNHPDRPRRDTALLFFVLFMSQAVPAVLPQNLGVLTLGRLLINTGYFLVITVLGHLQPVSLRVRRGALATFFLLHAAILGSIALPGANLLWLDLAIDLFGALVIVYTGAAVLQGAREAGGILRRRLLLIAAATYLVGFLTLVKVFLPVPAYLTSLGMLPFFPLAYLGFATPAWLVRIWQRAGLFTFLHDSAHLPRHTRSTAMLDHLLPAAARTVGAISTVAAMYEPGTDRLVLRPGYPGQPGQLDPATFPVDSEPLYLTTSAAMGPDLGPIATAMGAEAVMIVPIATAESTFGFLIAFLRHGALFPEDDLTLLNLMTEHVVLHLQLMHHNQTLEQRVQERTRALREAKVEILRHLARAAEFRDDDTGDHQERVGWLSARLAQHLGLPQDEVERIRLGAPLHDVGKIGIPDTILLKPGRLSEAEFSQIKAHTTIGAAIFADCQYGVLIAAREIALTHHEKWDGTGYPAGLAGEEIPLRGRIVAVADIFDALSHARNYKTAWPMTAALQEIERLSGTHLDPRIVAAFLELARSGEIPPVHTLDQVAAAG
ncbi:MAG: rpfG 6 [Symbiobacteriaceae bacterium]|jgi:hypothetical protein|nr:rpfG 6 [Symbiobacteriaceae bacterium]